MLVKELISKLEKEDPEAFISISEIAAKKKNYSKGGLCYIDFEKEIIVNKNPVFGFIDLSLKF